MCLSGQLLPRSAPRSIVSMRNVLALTLASLSVGLGAAGCGSSSPPSPDAGTPGAGAAVAVAVQPTVADVLTCRTLQLTALVTGTSNPAATWTLDGKGQVDAQGLYTAPLQVPSPS